ncbi:MAG: NAD(P)/FAD-dependent oxidoreductase, partial [Betaproteobacteria bacterium]
MTTSRCLDLAVIGGGAAGMFCAAVAAQRGLRVVLIDHSERRGEKIRISGGGRCNFTNREGGRLERYAGTDPGFARFALRAYPPERFIALVRRYGIGFHEKHKGQLFCDGSAEAIIAMLTEEGARAGVEERRPCALLALRVRAPDPTQARFELDTDQGTLRARSVVIATGGLSIPKIGASDLGMRLARQFGHRVVEPRPALVPLVFDATSWQPFAELAGIANPVRARAADSPLFEEDLLFTHRGLSGPAVLQVSSFWRPGQELHIDLLNGEDARAWLAGLRAGAGRRPLAAALADRLPRRLAQLWSARLAGTSGQEWARRPLAEFGNRDLERIAEGLSRWSLQPSGSEGYRKAEVTAGGVATDELDPRSMESRRVPGLYFIGEVVDVIGWLGGYNFQWAWASAFVAAESIVRGPNR